MRTGGAYEGIQRVKVPIFDAGVKTGNQVLTMDHPMRELYLSNDSTVNPLTVVVTGDASLSLTFVLSAGQVMDERLPEFTVVTVTATDSWSYRVRSGRVT